MPRHFTDKHTGAVKRNVYWRKTHVGKKETSIGNWYKVKKESHGNV